MSSIESKITFTPLRIPFSLLPTSQQWAGIDRGGSLTKIIYITPEAAENPEDPEYRLFQCIYFHNDLFNEVIQWLKENAFLPPSRGALHASGFGSINARKFIEETLGVELYIVEEFLSQNRGTYNLIRYFPLEEICYSPVEEKVESFEPIFFKMIRDNLREKLNTANAPENDEKSLPALLVFVGSATGITSMDEDGKATILSACLVGGKFFVGLAKALSGTSSFTEICELASRGNRGNVDMQMKDMMSAETIKDNLSSGKFNSELLDKPGFFYGKLADRVNPLTEYNVEDLLHSHVSSTAASLVQATLLACRSEGIRNVFFGGNLMIGEIIRIEIDRWMKVFSNGIIKTHFLKFGHTGAIGAMLTSAIENAKHIEN